MKDLIKQLRDCGDAPYRLSYTELAVLAYKAADALERMQWNPDMEAAPWEFKRVLLFKDGEYFTAARVSGAHGPGWLTPDGYEVLNPTKWMHLPPE